MEDIDVRRKNSNTCYFRTEVSKTNGVAMRVSDWGIHENKRKGGRFPNFYILFKLKILKSLILASCVFSLPLSKIRRISTIVFNRIPFPQ